MSVIKLFHGSQVVVEKPLFGYGKTYNDYGQGFYCTEHIELAKEWACPINNNGFVNGYELDTDGLKILDLSNGYNVLNWIAILLENRLVKLSTPLQKSAKTYLIDNFLPDYKDYDVIIGYRADDSYFLFARSFISNQISLSQLEKAMKIGKLGNQICLKSKKAFSRIRFIKSTRVDSSIYYRLKKEREDTARKEFLHELESDDIHGIFIRDIIKENIKNGDSRIR